ncbi:MAG: hypothetical protein H7X99_04235 [Saprospiraceae bacterium]|nr:hypothetical protein [Saprospiraceae bacterium]
MNASIFLIQVQKMSTIMVETLPFIIKNRLWEGFLKHKLVLILSIIAAITIPWSLIKYVASNTKELYSANFESNNVATASIQNAMSFSSLFEGSNKYILIILIQMLVVYFSNKTIEHLSGVVIKMLVPELIQSQWRVIVVSVRNWVLELIIGIGIAVVIGFFGADFLEDWLMWIVQCYFVGYLFMDNYNNTFGLKIKESTTIIRRHVGAALIIGLVAKILFLLPVAGLIIASFICSVSATWYMHTSDDAHAGHEAFV